MTHHVEVPTIDDLMRHAADLVSSNGVHIEASRGPCTEVVGATFELTHPRARVSRSAGRGRLFSALGELCWYLSGSNATEDITYYIPEYRRDDEMGSIFGGYGPRLRYFDGRDQVAFVVEKLRESPSSRQAVIQLFDHEDMVEAHKDVPCTCTLQYLLREGELIAITYMRSNDVYLGMPHDVFCFTMLQELIARSLSVEPGIYHHMVGSLHVYDETRGAVDRFLGEGWQSTNQAMPPMPEGDPWPAVMHLLDVERRLRLADVEPTEMDFSADPYWGDLERLLAVFAARKGPKDVLEGLRSAMSSRYYDAYIFDRIDAIPNE